MATGVVPHLLLDALSRASLASQSPALSLLTHRVLASGADASVVVLISGSNRSFEEIDRACRAVPRDALALGIRIAPQESPRFTPTSSAVIAQLSALEQLPSMLRRQLES
jgi:hypothetical protein